MLSLAGVSGLDDVVPVELTVLILYFAKVCCCTNIVIVILILLFIILLSAELCNLEPHNIYHDQRSRECL